MPRRQDTNVFESTQISLFLSSSLIISDTHDNFVRHLSYLSLDGLNELDVILSTLDARTLNVSEGKQISLFLSAASSSLTPIATSLNPFLTCCLMDLLTYCLMGAYPVPGY